MLTVSHWLSDAKKKILVLLCSTIALIVCCQNALLVLSGLQLSSLLVIDYFMEFSSDLLKNLKKNMFAQL